MEPDTIERCIRFAESHQVNAVLYGYANNVDGVRGRPHQHELRQEYRGKEIVEQLMPHFLGHSFDDINQWIRGKRGMRQGKEHTALWRIMLDTETIRRNGILFDCNLSLGEDTRFINEYMLHEQSIGFLDECLYYLTIRQTGANLSSKANVEKRQADKLKLIKARKEIDRQALVLYSADTHCYWEGTMVFSALELIVMLIRNRKLGLRAKTELYKEFIGNEDVKSAVMKFQPAFGLKAIPFWTLKCIMIFC